MYCLFLKIVADVIILALKKNTMKKKMHYKILIRVVLTKSGLIRFHLMRKAF